MNLVVIIFCCYMLHRWSVEKGLPQWRYVLRFMGLIFLACIIAGYAAIWLFGPDVIETPEGRANLIYVEPFIMLFEISLFLYFRKKINDTDLHQEDNTDDNPPPGDGKKDLSYFR